MQDKNTIISLFDFTGTWSNPYKNAGYNVIQIDIKKGIDILIWDYKKIVSNSVYGILAAPPCTHFTKASSLHWKKYDNEGLTDKSILLIRKTIEIVNYFNPVFWCLENPPGRLSKLIPELSFLKLYRFSPWQFGDPFFKQTELYGNFNPFLIHTNTKPLYTIKDTIGKPSIMKYYRKHYKGFDRQALRSITPRGFSNAFFLANNHTSFTNQNLIQHESITNH